MDHKILMVIAPQDFRDEEYLIPRRYFEKKGYEVKVATQDHQNECIGSLGMKVKPDFSIHDVGVSNYSAVVFVGGMGSKTYFNNQTILQLVKDCVIQEKVLGAICISPVILANAGVLNEKNATVSKGSEKDLIQKGAKYTGKPVEIDGKIVTASGPLAAEEFARAIVSLL